MTRLIFFAVQLIFASPASSGSQKVLYPEDLGPAEIDVSGYPPEHQEAYRKIFLPVFHFFGETARIVNSPFLELNSELEERERQRNPELFSDPMLLQPSSNVWKKRVEAIRLRPPCCGACPVLGLKEARRLWEFLVYDSLVRKAGTNASVWIQHRQGLLRRFRKVYPKRFQELYSQMKKKEENL